MSSKKRRKLENTPGPPVSAFAARRTIITERVITHSQAVEESQEISVGTKISDAEVEDAYSSSNSSSSSPSHAPSPELILERPLPSVFSTFTPSRGNVKELPNGDLSLKLAPGERLIILGEYELSVRKGKVAILHMTLGPSKNRYRVCAPSSHSLPVIRCLGTDIRDAEISLHHCGSGLRELESLSPLFAKMWSNASKALESSHQPPSSGKSTFQILLSPRDALEKTYIQPLISPPEWNEMLARLSTRDNKESCSTFICGPKSSGKSTFTKLLTNRLLSEDTSFSSKKQTGVAILDLDPGQPEYSIPGQISLVHVVAPNFGPPFSHPIGSKWNRIIRAHAIGAITPAQDPDYYISCALDLFSRYHSLLSQFPSCPLVVNTPGWVLGTGLELLIRLVARIRPASVIYMSKEGPPEVVRDLQATAEMQAFSTLPSQISEYATRTAAHLRAMQTMSYLHIDPNGGSKSSWNGLPLMSIAPWELKYSGENCSLLGVLCYGEPPSAELLADLINGSLVAIVVIEENTAIPGWKEHTKTGDNREASVYHRPTIIRTPNSNLPYFNPLNAITLSPQHSHCIGHALVRGIDITHQRLQLITPISPKVIEDMNEHGTKIVIVSGKLDTPGWAYTECLVGRDLGNKKESDEELEESGNVTNVPWVEKLKDSSGRGINAKVWRVRRDLGKSETG